MKMAEDDFDLEGYFAEARGNRDALPEALAARMRADALAAQEILSAPNRHRPGFWAQFAGALGGWRGIGGLATACAAGIWIGYAPPGIVPDPVNLVLNQIDETDPFDTVGFSDIIAEANR